MAVTYWGVRSRYSIRAIRVPLAMALVQALLRGTGRRAPPRRARSARASPWPASSI
ncbi:MAG: hypothetical protein U0641_02755 [Anaerolineae bacterium]